MVIVRLLYYLYYLYGLLGSMTDQNLREHVLNTTSHLRQQLLEAVDRLEQRGGQDRLVTTLSAAASCSSGSGVGSHIGKMRCMQ